MFENKSIRPSTAWDTLRTIISSLLRLLKDLCRHLCKLLCILLAYQCLLAQFIQLKQIIYYWFVYRCFHFWYLVLRTRKMLSSAISISRIKKILSYFDLIITTGTFFVVCFSNLHKMMIDDRDRIETISLSQVQN